MSPPPKTRSQSESTFDVIIVGGGASGMIAAISAARRGRRVLICEQSKSMGIKLLASGGERCNLSNTLGQEQFMERVRPHGRFMGPALELLGGPKLRQFFEDIGQPTVVLDGFRVWPENRKSKSVLAAILAELERLNIGIQTNCHVTGIHSPEEDGEGRFLVQHKDGELRAESLILATGGLALPSTGASGEGYRFAEGMGHRTTPRHPAGVPFLTAEDWTARCTAHTIGKAFVQVVLPKAKAISATGDLIFTKRGLRGPVVLDLSRDISPLLEKYGEVPIEVNMCRGKNQEDWQQIFKAWKRSPPAPVAQRRTEHLPLELSEVMCELAGVPSATMLHALAGQARDDLIRVLVRTPLTITGTTGYNGAFVTRGGVRLKDVRPETMESKRQPGLYFCGEVLDIDGPCGGFNLQWAFASGYLAGSLA
jgi:predicted Rossmann fold flavoprotein